MNETIRYCQSEGTWVTGMERPRTIHDFYGFPQVLFDVQFPAHGDPELARSIQSSVSDPRINLDLELWGYDHGTWSVLRHMYPKNDVPVLQLSVYLERPASYHYAVGSGNVVHNLRQLRWEENARPYDWAIEFDNWIKHKIAVRDYRALQEDYLKTEAGRLSVPGPDHYYPLHYVLGAAGSNEAPQFEYEEIQNGSISMRCISFGA